MNTRKSILVALSLLIIAAFVLSACQPVQTTVEVIRTVEVPGEEVVKTVEVVTTQEVTVVETQVVEVERGAFTTPHPILSDLRVRQAMAYCTNKPELIQSVYPKLTPEEQEALVMNTMIPPSQWAYAGDENITVYPFDPEAGMALLEEAGWTLTDPEAFPRTNADGDALSLKFTTTNAAFRQTWAAVWEQQMANCGIQVVRLHAPASWWFGDTTGLARRDYELGAYAWVGQVDPGGATLWACDQIPFPENGWTGQNTMGWCNDKASVGIKNATNTLLQEDRKKWYTDVQAAYTEDVPAIPLFNRAEFLASTAGMEGFAPTSGEEYYTYNAGEWALPGTDTIVLGLTQEPATLYFVEDAFVAHVVLTLLGANGKQNTTLGFDFQPYHLTEMPTLESGRSVNAEVEVNEGDKVVDADGNVSEVTTGTKLRNTAGEVVEFDGTPVMMNQMTVNYEFRPDLTWPDGEPLKAEDLELAWKIKCDKESGATSFITCDQTASTAFEGTTFTRTALPGEQDPLYMHLTDYYPFPAHRVLSDGRMLKDVPASEWLTLPETTETPWGFGPYMVTEWVKGEKIVLEAHPYWFGGTPATPNFVVSIITPENAEAQLLGGQVDILGSETLISPSDVLYEEAANGAVDIYTEASATWEHIDMNLFVK
jgi:ABC-type transport system substrate-binding protein